MTRTEINKKFPRELAAVKYFERIRWGKKPKCAYCGSTQLSRRTIDLRFKCYQCNKTSSVTVGTLLHGTNMELRKWLIAFSIVSNADKGITTRQLKKELLWINYATAWRVFNKLRHLMDVELFDNIIMTRIFERISPRKLRKRFRGYQRTINKCIRLKSKREPILDTKDEKSNLRFSKIMAYIAKADEFFLWMHYIDKDMVAAFWSLIERQIKVLHNPIELKYLHKYILEAIFEITPSKNANIFDTLVKNSMRLR